jgi:hypothetical protein
MNMKVIAKFDPILEQTSSVKFSETYSTVREAEYDSSVTVDPNVVEI